MRNVSVLKGMTVWAASLGLLLPPQCLMGAETGASPTKPVGTAAVSHVNEQRPNIDKPSTDFELDKNGLFSGQIVDAQGQPQAGAAVILHGRNQQYKTVSDAKGWFHFAKLSGGTYRLETGGSQQLFRLWTHGTAPPKSNQKMLVVQQGKMIVLGQYCGDGVNCGSGVGSGGYVKNALTNPLVIGGIIAAAIAIPVAIHNADDDDPPAS